jgi:hypothetical protein
MMQALNFEALPFLLFSYVVEKGNISSATRQLSVIII